MNTEQCSLSCAVCGRLCKGTGFGRQNHRFDCCGVVAAHIPVVTRTKEETWRRVDNPNQAGYVTGPTQTRRRGA